MKKCLDTKQILSTSFQELLKLTPLQKITIKKIVNYCGLTRQTFYLHFKDKYDLVHWIYKRNNDQIVDYYINLIPWQDILCTLLSNHKKNKKFILSLIEYSGQNSLNEYLDTYTYETYCRVLSKTPVMNGEYLFALKLYSSGSAQMTSTWLQKGMKESPEYMSAGLVNSMIEDIRIYLP